MSSRRIAVCIEAAPKVAVASALDWPGWSRAGRGEDAALEALAGCAERYRPVAELAGIPFPSTAVFEVVDRPPGASATAFAAAECRRPFPQLTTELDREKVTPAAAARLAGLITATWAAFDEIAAAAPAELRKGPRGGGRDRDQVIEHVLAAETIYARKLGVRLKRPAVGDPVAIEELREAIAAVVGTPADGAPVVPGGWTSRYAARRIAWHVLEHAWEMQDRTET